MNYYGIAQTSTRRYGIVFVTKEPGRPSSQVFTGESFKTMKAAEAAMNEKNAVLPGFPKNWLEIVGK